MCAKKKNVSRGRQANSGDTDNNRKFESVQVECSTSGCQIWTSVTHICDFGDDTGDGPPFYCGFCAAKQINVLVERLNQLEKVLQCDGFGQVPNGSIPVNAASTECVSAECNLHKRATLANIPKSQSGSNNNRVDNDEPNVSAVPSEMAHNSQMQISRRRSSVITAQPQHESIKSSIMTPGNIQHDVGMTRSVLLRGVSKANVINSQDTPSLNSMASAYDSRQVPRRREDFHNREQCLIIANVKESVAINSQARLDDDLGHLQSILSVVLHECQDEVVKSMKIKAAFRLGKISNELRPRLLKVVFNSAEIIHIIFNGAYRLKGSSIRLLRDLSIADRLRLKEAKSELACRLELGEKNLTIQNF